MRGLLGIKPSVGKGPRYEEFKKAWEQRMPGKEISVNLLFPLVLDFPLRSFNDVSTNEPLLYWKCANLIGAPIVFYLTVKLQAQVFHQR